MFVKYLQSLDGPRCHFSLATITRRLRRQELTKKRTNGIKAFNILTSDKGFDTARISFSNV